MGVGEGSRNGSRQNGKRANREKSITFNKKTSAEKKGVDEIGRRRIVWLICSLTCRLKKSVMLRQSHRFLGMYQYFGELKVPCSMTLHGDRGALNRDL